MGLLKTLEDQGDCWLNTWLAIVFMFFCIGFFSGVIFFAIMEHLY